MSGLLGQLLGGVLGGQQGGQPAGIAGVLQQVLASNGGGIAGIVSQFEAAGLGNTIQSWIGTGTNAPISAEQVGKVFSGEQLQDWAAQACTTPDKISEILAQALPHAVDQVTPDGQVPAPNAMPDLTSLIGRFLGGAAR